MRSFYKFLSCSTQRNTLLNPSGARGCLAFSINDQSVIWVSAVVSDAEIITRLPIVGWIRPAFYVLSFTAAPQ